MVPSWPMVMVLPSGLTPPRVAVDATGSVYLFAPDWMPSSFCLSPLLMRPWIVVVASRSSASAFHSSQLLEFQVRRQIVPVCGSVRICVVQPSAVRCTIRPKCPTPLGLCEQVLPPPAQ